MNNQAKKTFCNPINLNYAYRVYDAGAPICIEAADPVVVLFNDKYFLFSSVTYGYWWSNDMAEWTFIDCQEGQLPTIFGYAPALMVMDGHVYWHQGYHDKRLYRSNNPLDTKTWELVTDNCYLGHDPFMFYDKDEDKIWGSYGCDDLHDEWIKVVQIRRDNCQPFGRVFNSIYADQKNRGWERPRDNHTQEGWGYTEGSQIFKHRNMWYLTYSGYSLHKCYANGVYTASKPEGPYEYAQNNPCSHKNTGFIGGAGHGSFFEDRYGNWWNATCSAVYVSHPFERRVNIYPAGIDSNGYLFVNSTLSDYPITLPTDTRDHSELHVKSMLLSKDKTATVSSTDSGIPLNPIHGEQLPTTEVPESRYDHSTKMALDEDIRTFWSAASGKENEWFCIDLGDVCTVDSVQLSFTLYNVLTEDVAKNYTQYKLESSVDGVKWDMLEDKWANKTFVPHDYLELETPVIARFIKVTNKYMAGDGFFALGDFRVFGNANGKAPDAISAFSAVRDSADNRNAAISWSAVNGADGYVVKYGIKPDKLYNQYQVYGTTADVRTLTNGISYFFRVDTFNASGYTMGKTIEFIK